MKIRIENLAGRHLGTFDADNDVTAFDLMCQEAGYRDGDEGERKRFACYERCVFLPDSEVH